MGSNFECRKFQKDMWLSLLLSRLIWFREEASEQVALGKQFFYSKFRGNYADFP